jgi:hypothetical protein
MHKARFFVLLSLLLSGCSYTDLLRLAPTNIPPAVTATATIFVTPSQTASVTPTQPTPTFTSTPTLIYPNGTPPPSPTATPVFTASIPATATETEVAQPLLGSGPFSTILISDKQLVWGTCTPSSVTATVQLANGVPAFGVMIMLRLQDTATGEITAWGGGAIMDKQGNGVFTYDLTAKSFTHYKEHAQAWGQYQFIAYDANLKRVGTSTVYLNNLTISQCQ